MTQPILNSHLIDWLHHHWRSDNHNKYQHLFEEWLNNITTSQIYYFNKQMYNEVNKVLY